MKEWTCPGDFVWLHPTSQICRCVAVSLFFLNACIAILSMGVWPILFLSLSMCVCCNSAENENILPFSSNAHQLYALSRSACAGVLSLAFFFFFFACLLFFFCSLLVSFATANTISETTNNRKVKMEIEVNNRRLTINWQTNRLVLLEP